MAASRRKGRKMESVMDRLCVLCAFLRPKASDLFRRFAALADFP
jgi:hypothetical protein